MNRSARDPKWSDSERAARTALTAALEALAAMGGLELAATASQHALRLLALRLRAKGLLPRDWIA